MQYTSQMQRIYDLLKYYAVQDWKVSKVYLYNGIFLGCCMWFCYIAFFLFFDKEIKRKKSIIIYFFLVYMMVVYQLTISSRAAGSRMRVDLRPFATFTGGLRDGIFILENIMMFVPLGIFLPLIWEKQKQANVLLVTSCAASILIEITQLLTRRGYCQTDDVLTNTVGAGIGFLIYRECRHIRKNIRKRKGKESNERTINTKRCR